MKNSIEFQLQGKIKIIKKLVKMKDSKMLTNLTPKTPSQTRSRNSVLKPLNLLSRMNMEETEVIQSNLKDHANEVFKNENIEFNQRYLQSV